MESYKIRLRENAMLYAVSAPRRVPLPLQKKKKKKEVKMELKRLEDLDLIRLVCTDSRCAKREQRRYPVV